MTDPTRPRTEAQPHRLHKAGRTSRRPRIGFQAHHLPNVGRTYWDLPAPALYEEAIRRNEGAIADSGSLVVSTGRFTGRSPKDKFVVQEPTSDKHVWWGPVNRPLDAEHFDRLRQRLSAYFQGRETFAQNLYAGADPNYRLPIRVITEGAWHNLFARIMFINPPREALAHHNPQFTITYAPGCEADPATLPTPR